MYDGQTGSDDELPAKQGAGLGPDRDVGNWG